MEYRGSSFNELIKRTHEFTETSRRRSWFHVLSTIAVIGFLGYFTKGEFPTALRAVASVCTGLVMVRYFILYHDYAHGAILRNSLAAKVLMQFSGLLFLRGLGEWSRSHNFHHAHNTKFETSSVGSYQTWTTQTWESATPGQRRIYRTIRNPFVMVFGYVTVFLLEAFKKLFFKDNWLRLESFCALVIHAAFFTLCWRAGHLALLFSFTIPYMVACSVGAYLFYVQHNFEGAKLVEDHEWQFGQAALESSSCIRGGWLFHYLTGNIGYHHIHHLNPKVPFYRLPEAMAAIPALQNPVFVQLTPRTVWRSLGLKLWDAETQKLVHYNYARSREQAVAFEAISPVA